MLCTVTLAFVKCNILLDSSRFVFCFFLTLENQRNIFFNQKAILLFTWQGFSGIYTQTLPVSLVFTCFRTLLVYFPCSRTFPLSTTFSQHLFPHFAHSCRRFPFFFFVCALYIKVSFCKAVLLMRSPVVIIQSWSLQGIFVVFLSAVRSISANFFLFSCLTLIYFFCSFCSTHWSVSQ